MIGVFKSVYPRLTNYFIGWAQIDIDQIWQRFSICIPITLLDQSLTLNRKIIIKESDLNISYHSEEKNSCSSPLMATCSEWLISLWSYLTVVGKLDCTHCATKMCLLMIGRMNLIRSLSSLTLWDFTGSTKSPFDDQEFFKNVWTWCIPKVAKLTRTETQKREILLSLSLKIPQS